jgi:glycosyltransferase involved in cell wall biosynthesis
VKLLIYAHFFAPSIGGVENIVLSLARGFADLRTSDGRPEFDVTVATQTPAAEFDDGALPFPVVRRPGFVQLWRLIRKADVAHIAGPSLAPLLLCWLARKPAVVEHHGYQAVCPNGLLFYLPTKTVCPGYFQSRQYGQCLRCNAQEWPWWRNLTSLFLMFPRYLFARRAAANIGITHHVVQRHALPQSSTVYYGIEDPLRTGGAPNETTKDSGEIRFAYVGRLVGEKGLPILLGATHLLREAGEKFEVCLIGDGPERPRLEKQIAALGIADCIKLTGFLSGAALTKALAGVKVVIMSSIWEETAGLSAIEQMMRGRVVIASDIGGLGEVVDDTGLKCPPGNAEALAGAMKRVIHEPFLVTALGRKARERALRLFGRRRMVEEHARVLRDLARAKAR